MEQRAASANRPPPPKPAAGPAFETVLRSARLYSGLVMFCFVTMHLANHALGLVSLAAAEAGRLWFLAVWRNPPATLVLYGAVLVHVTLVLRSLYLRRTFAMPAREAAQTLLGLLIPLLLAEHVIGTRVFHELTGVEDTYEFVARALWITTPQVGARQALALLVVWAHGCLGLHFWLRFRPWYPAAAPWLLIAAVLVPVLALLGFADARPDRRHDGSPAAPAHRRPVADPGCSRPEGSDHQHDLRGFRRRRRAGPPAQGMAAAPRAPGPRPDQTTKAASASACRRAPACSRQAASAASRIIRPAAAEAAARHAGSG